MPAMQNVCRNTILYCVLPIFCMLYGLPVRAGMDQDEARQAVESGMALPFSRIQERMQNFCQCRILEAKLHWEEKKGRRFLVYEIKAISPEDRILKLQLEAVNGEILQIKQKGTKHGWHE